MAAIQAVRYGKLPAIRSKAIEAVTPTGDIKVVGARLKKNRYGLLPGTADHGSEGTWALLPKPIVAASGVRILDLLAILPI